MCGEERSAETSLKKEVAMPEKIGVSRKDIAEIFAGNKKRVGFFWSPYYLFIYRFLQPYLAGAQILLMRKLFFSLVVVTPMLVSGCGFAGRKLLSSGEPGETAWLGKRAYVLQVSGAGKEISDEAEAIATDYCRELDKEYKFLIKRFRDEAGLIGSDQVVCELYFDCVGKAETATASRKKKKPKPAVAPAAPPPIPVEPEPEPEPELEPETEPVASQKPLPTKPEAPEAPVATGVKKSKKIKLVGPKGESGGVPSVPFPGGASEGGLGEPESLGFDGAETGKAKFPPFSPPGVIVEEKITE